MNRSPAVVGIADHCGWAIFVTVIAPDGAPVVVDRRRVPTIDEGLPSTPYHHEALELDSSEAETLIERVQLSVKARSERALTALLEDLRPQCELKTVTLRDAPEFPIPETLSGILASRRALNAMDGEMYRRALRDGATALGLEVHTHARKPAFDARLESFVTGLRRELGAPWQKDHRTAAAAAMEVLADQITMRLP